MRQPVNPLENPTGERPLQIPLGDGSDQMVSVIIVHHNRPAMLNLCVQSVHVMSNLNNYEMIVVDNASDQETQEYLDVLRDEGIKVVRNDSNIYWSKAANQGVAVADPNSKYFVFLHDDVVILDRSWLDILVNISEGRRSGLVGTEFSHYFIQRQKTDFLQEWCLLMSRQCWQDIGPWPEELPLVGQSFIMTYRAHMKGHNPQVTGNKIAHHYKDFFMDPSEFERISEAALGQVGRLMQAAQKR